MPSLTASRSAELAQAASQRTSAALGRTWVTRAGPRKSIATIWLSHPGRRNALTQAMWQDLAKIFAQLAGEPGIRAVVIRGEGDAFASGADVSEFPSHRATREQVHSYHDELVGSVLKSILNCPVPVLAAIDGPCVGEGLSLASVCDIRLATHRSSFGLPIGRLGFPLAPHEAACIVSVVGRANTLELLLDVRLWSAQEAQARGLVGRLCAPESFEQEVQETIQRIASAAPHAARRNKWLVQTMTRFDDEQILTPSQRESCWDYVDTRDYARGIDAFLAKTKPEFQDE